MRAHEFRYCSLGDVVTLPDGVEQRMWSDHCVQNTEGAESPGELDVDLEDIIIQKGTEEVKSSPLWLLYLRLFAPV